MHLLVLIWKLGKNTPKPRSQTQDSKNPLQTCQPPTSRDQTHKSKGEEGIRAEFCHKFNKKARKRIQVRSSPQLKKDGNLMKDEKREARDLFVVALQGNL